MKPMRSTLTVAAAAVAFSLSAQNLPQPSPKGKVEQVVGLTNVSIEYSRPSAKGRQVFGDVVPFEQLWRAGANSSTKITFDQMVMINKTKVMPGTYSILITPHKDAWMIHLNSNDKLNGTNGYDEKLDVVTVKSPVVNTDFLETLTFDFADVVNDGATVEIRWEKSKAGFRIEAPATEQGLKNIDLALAEKEVKAGTYGQCARFCIDRGVRTKEALTWAEKSVSMDPKFWTVHTLALAYAANGEKDKAIEAAKRSREMAKAENAEAYVKLNDEKLKEWGQ